MLTLVVNRVLPDPADMLLFLAGSGVALILSKVIVTAYLGHGVIRTDCVTWR
jgi:hypothetical protein